MQKFRFHTFAMAIGIFVFLILQCERTLIPFSSSEKIEYLQGNTNAHVIIKLFDRYSNAPLKGATVTIIGFDSAVSDSAGVAVFDSVKVGTYLLACSKNSYESTLDDFSLTIDSNSTTIPVVSQSTEVIYMAKKGATVKGTVYYKDKSKMYPVNGATLECRLSTSAITFQNPLVTTTTKSGSYTFGNLPEYVTYTIRVLPFENGSVTYKQSGSVSLGGVAAGDTLRANDIVLQKFIDGNFIVLNHNLETFTQKDSLKIEFSEPVDINKVEPDSVYITLFSSGKRILTRQIWQDSNKKLVIFPFKGVWDSKQSYRLTIRNIESVSGKPLVNDEYNPYTFFPTMVGSLGKVENIKVRVGYSDSLKIDYTTSSVYLHWSPLKNASSYQLYQKASSDSAWILLTMVSDTLTSISTSGYFYNGKQLQIIVLGKNSKSVSSFDSASIVTLKDEQQPYIFMSTTQYGFNNSASGTLKRISMSISSSYLSEPMDTTKKPLLKVFEASYGSGSFQYGDTLYRVDPALAEWTWTTNRSGVMSIAVAASKNGAYDSLKIDFSNVTDLAGNKPDTTLGRGVITILTRN